MIYKAVLTNHLGGPVREMVYIKAEVLNDAFKIAESVAKSMNLKVNHISPTTKDYVLKGCLRVGFRE